MTLEWDFIASIKRRYSIFDRVPPYMFATLSIYMSLCRKEDTEQQNAHIQESQVHIKGIEIRKTLYYYNSYSTYLKYDNMVMDGEGEEGITALKLSWI